MACRTAGTVALKIAYGYENENDEFRELLKDTEEAVAMFAMAALPGVFLVDTLPFRASSARLLSRRPAADMLLTRG